MATRIENCLRSRRRHHFKDAASPACSGASLVLTFWPRRAINLLNEWVEQTSTMLQRHPCDSAGAWSTARAPSPKRHCCVIRKHWNCVCRTANKVLDRVTTGKRTKWRKCTSGRRSDDIFWIRDHYILFAFNVTIVLRCSVSEIFACDTQTDGQTTPIVTTAGPHDYRPANYTKLSTVSLWQFYGRTWDLECLAVPTNSCESVFNTGLHSDVTHNFDGTVAVSSCEWPPFEFVLESHISLQSRQQYQIWYLVENLTPNNTKMVASSSSNFL